MMTLKKSLSAKIVAVAAASSVLVLSAATQVDWTQIKNRPTFPTVPITIPNGGTGVTTAAAALVALGAAASGANSDITSLTGLSTLLPKSEGGTGTNQSQGNGAKVQYSTGSTATNDLVIYDANGNTITSGQQLANLTTAASNATAANQLCVSGGANKACTWVDLPETHVYPMAACNVNVAGPGASIPTSNAPVVDCRTGTNVQAGLIKFSSANQNVQFQAELPADWDTSSNPYISLNLTQGNGNGSQTITMQAAVACGATDDAAFQTAQSFPNVTTNTTANTQYRTTLQFNSTSMTSCAAGMPMNIKIIANALGTNQAWVQFAIMTFPRRIVVQAN